MHSYHGVLILHYLKTSVTSCNIYMNCVFVFYMITGSYRETQT